MHGTDLVCGRGLKIPVSVLTEHKIDLTQQRHFLRIRHHIGTWLNVEGH